MYGWWKEPDCTVAASVATFSGFIRTPPWPISDAAICASCCTGTAPSKVGMPVCQFRPMPKTSRASLVRSSSWRSLACEMKALLQDAAKLCANVPSLISDLLRFWNFQPPTVTYLGQGFFLSGAVRPLSISSAEVTTFIVEPGAYDPWVAMLKPLAGELASARISPVLGLTAAAEASFLPATAFSAAAWSLASRVVFKVPGVPLESTFSVLSGCWSAGLVAVARWMNSSTPGLPLVLLPYLSRRLSRTPASEGYALGVSSVPLRSTALIGGASASPVRSSSPLARSGCRIAGCQAICGFPVVLFRWTEAAVRYEYGTFLPL